MPMHDWTRLKAHAYHDFHTEWIVAVKRVLNGGLLPTGYYARAEQTVRTMGPDVLTLQSGPTPSGSPVVGSPTAPRFAVPSAPPRVRVTARVTPPPPWFKQKRVGIYHSSHDRLIAIIELLSPGNKSSRPPIRTFAQKIVRAVHAGIHALVIDPFPPGPRDPNGIHGVIWPALGGDPFTLPAGEPLTCAAYESAAGGIGSGHRCYVEPYAVGQPLPVMPLFLEPDEYVNVPLEQSYQDAYADVVPQDRAILEAP